MLFRSADQWEDEIGVAVLIEAGCEVCQSTDMQMVSGNAPGVALGVYVPIIGHCFRSFRTGYGISV